MKAMKYLTTVLAHPSILKPYKHIYLLSHMRANTSLFGHLLGSNPEIEGYFELHIGYRNWQSLIKQKLLYFSEHPPKKNAVYIFDKILHNEHELNTNVIAGSKVVIMIREPNASINSIVNLYKTINPQHEYSTVAGASAYYVARLRTLTELASSLSNGFYFLNAEDITTDPDCTLNHLSQWLKLKTPLSKQYQIFKNTNKLGAGDSSVNMAKGIIQAKQNGSFQVGNMDPKIDDLYADAITTFKSLSEN